MDPIFTSWTLRANTGFNSGDEREGGWGYDEDAVTEKL